MSRDSEVAKLVSMVDQQAADTRRQLADMGPQGRQVLSETIMERWSVAIRDKKIVGSIICNLAIIAFFTLSPETSDDTGG